MDFVYIERRLWNKIRDHAQDSDPNECIGYFEGKPEGAGNLRLTEVFPCRNIDRYPKHKGRISKADEKQIKQLFDKNGKKGYIYGMYHSHPSTGTVYLSEKDSLIGKIYRRFRHQIVAAIYGKSRRVKMAYWNYKKPHWHEVEIMIKRRNNA